MFSKCARLECSTYADMALKSNLSPKEMDETAHTCATLAVRHEIDTAIECPVVTYMEEL